MKAVLLVELKPSLGGCSVVFFSVWGMFVVTGCCGSFFLASRGFVFSTCLGVRGQTADV